MHPGNILVKEVDTSATTGVAGWLINKLKLQFPPKLILLDVGMIAELTPSDRSHLIAFFKALTKQDGEQLGHAILDMSEAHTCKHPDAFVTDLRAMFDALDPEYIHRHTSAVIESVIDTLRAHQVRGACVEWGPGRGGIGSGAGHMASSMVGCWFGGSMGLGCWVCGRMGNLVVVRVYGWLVMLCHGSHAAASAPFPTRPFALAPCAVMLASCPCTCALHTPSPCSNRFASKPCGHPHHCPPVILILPSLAHHCPLPSPHSSSIFFPPPR